MKGAALRHVRDHGRPWRRVAAMVNELVVCKKQRALHGCMNECLVGGFKPSEKYESHLEGLSHILWKKMFETTNQPYVYYSYYICK